MKEKNRWATFAIRSIDGLSSADVTQVPAEKAADGDVRTVTLTAHGEFFMHGHKVNKDAALEIKLHYPAGAPADAKPAGHRPGIQGPVAHHSRRARRQAP